MKNYYSILNIPESAGEEEIRQAYRRLAFRYHPDRGGGSSNSEHFREIKEAYEVLSDPVKRRHYDAVLRQQKHRPYAPSYELFKYSTPSQAREEKKADKGMDGPKKRSRFGWFIKPFVLLLIGLLLLQLIIHPPQWLLHYLGK